MAKVQPFLRKPMLRTAILTWRAPRLGQATRTFLLAFGLGLLALPGTRGVRGAEELPSEFYHDFRGRPLPPELLPVNSQEGPLFQFEPEGLRISIPRT